MKRVLHILSSNSYSGAENVAATIIRSTEDDYEVYYCSPEGPIEEVLKRQGIKYIPLRGNKYLAITKTFRKMKPDIVHAHDYKATILSALASRNCKIISHIHQSSAMISSASLKSTLFKICSKKIATIIWVSKEAYDSLPVKIKDKSVFLRNVIDSEYLKKVSKNNRVKSYDVIFLGRLTYVKDPDRFIDIVNKVCADKPNLRAVIVGDGDLRAHIERKVKELGLKEKIDIVGYRKNPYPFLENSKILVMTSRSEGTPMVVLESLSFGKPVVSTPVGDNKAIVSNGCGYISDDDNLLAEKILTLLKPANYNRISRLAIRQFEKINDIETYISEIKRIYDGKK